MLHDQRQSLLANVFRDSHLPGHPHNPHPCSLWKIQTILTLFNCTIWGKFSPSLLASEHRIYPNRLRSFSLEFSLSWFTPSLLSSVCPAINMRAHPLLNPDQIAQPQYLRLADATSRQCRQSLCSSTGYLSSTKPVSTTFGYWDPCSTMHIQSSWRSLSVSM